MRFDVPSHTEQLSWHPSVTSQSPISFTSLWHKIKSLSSCHLAICSATSASLHCFLSLYHAHSHSFSLSFFWLTHAQKHTRTSEHSVAADFKFGHSFWKSWEKQKNAASRSNYSTMLGSPEKKRKKNSKTKIERWKDGERGLSWVPGSG